MLSNPSPNLPLSRSPATPRPPSSTAVAAILATMPPLPTRLLGGALCDVVCEFCPLRAWKSPGITTVHCQQVLAKAREPLEQTAHP
jgi:hypothetical protein